MRAIEAVTAKGETSALCQSIGVSRASLYRRRRPTPPATRRCCMNTRCGSGGVARTSRDPVWCNKSTVISLANRRGRVGYWTLERQCGLVPIHATTPLATSGTGRRSASRRIVTICFSVNRVFFMAPPCPEDAILSSVSWSEKWQAGQ